MAVLPPVLSEPAGAVELEGGFIGGLEVVHSAQGGTGRGDGDESALARQILQERSVCLARDGSGENATHKVHDCLEAPWIVKGFPSVFGQTYVTTHES